MFQSVKVRMDEGRKNCENWDRSEKDADCNRYYTSNTANNLQRKLLKNFGCLK